MKIIVAGGGRTGSQVARALVAHGHQVIVVEADHGRAPARVAEGLDVVSGNASVPTTLEAAGALVADVLVACTDRDEENLVISVLAKQRHQIPKVIARINDDANLWLFDDFWGVDAGISSARALVDLVAPPAH